MYLVPPEPAPNHGENPHSRLLAKKAWPTSAAKIEIQVQCVNRISKTERLFAQSPVRLKMKTTIGHMKINQAVTERPQARGEKDSQLKIKHKKYYNSWHWAEQSKSGLTQQRHPPGTSCSAEAGRSTLPSRLVDCSSTDCSWGVGTSPWGVLSQQVAD